MYGAICGDVIGSPYEHHNIKTKDFPLYSEKSRLTDDSIMTLACAESLMTYFDCNGTKDLSGDSDRESLKNRFIIAFRKWGLKYPNAGYGRAFYKWIHLGGEPYNSWGNGSAMRVSPIAWCFDDIEVVREVARISAEVTHNHPEGIKGAEAIASAVFLARTGKLKKDIREYITSEFGYDLSKTCDEIRPDYSFDVSCQGSVPQAIIAFLDGIDYEDVVRNAVSLGGDSDTIACMAGCIAEAYYGIGVAIYEPAIHLMTEDQLDIWKRFFVYMPKRITPGRINENIWPFVFKYLPEEDWDIAKNCISTMDI